MGALPLAEMSNHHPKAFSYLKQMKPILDQRKGFTAWDRSFQEESFYAIQRVGDYTFSAYKVAWRYIAADFLVAVIGPDANGRPRLPNDKVMFVAAENQEEAFYLCGVLSSDVCRWKVTAFSSGTQISASAIESLNIPQFEAANSLHLEICKACRDGHQAVSERNLSAAAAALERVNVATAVLFSIDLRAMRLFRIQLGKAHRTDWPALSTSDEER
jgi:hypothetical protein